MIWNCKRNIIAQSGLLKNNFRPGTRSNPSFNNMYFVRMPEVQSSGFNPSFTSFLAVWRSCRRPVCWSQDWNTPAPTSFPKYHIFYFVNVLLTGSFGKYFLLDYGLWIAALFKFWIEFIGIKFESRKLFFGTFKRSIWNPFEMKNLVLKQDQEISISNFLARLIIRSI